MQSRYTAAEIARIIRAALVEGRAAPPSPVERYEFDTRRMTVGAGAMFLALDGPARRGIDFAEEAYRLGCRDFLLPEPAGLPADARQVVAPDPLAALQTLAAHHRAQFKGPVVGITGSNGKTIVKEWLATLLEDDFALAKSPKSYNSQLGAALALLEIGPSAELAVIEAGVSQTGEMARLAQMIRPTVGVFTHLGDAHAEGFADLDEKFREKMRLFEGCEQLFVQARSEELSARKAGFSGLPVQFVGAEDGDYRLAEAEATDFGWRFAIDSGGDRHAFELFCAGEAALANALLALACANSLGADWPDLQRRARALAPVRMRTELITDNPEVAVLNDAWNADAASVGNAFSLLKRTPGARRLVVLTDLEHLGAKQEETQRRLLQEGVALFGPENLTTVGPAFGRLKSEFPETKHYPDTERLLADFRYADYRDAAVLLKGARRYRLERMVPYLTQRPRATVFRIDLNALRRNLRAFRQLNGPDTGLMVMLKAAAYGSGAWQLARALEREQIDYIGVAFTGEGAELRRRGAEAPVMVMCPEASALEQLSVFRLEPAVGSLDLLRRLAASGAELPVHLEFDTGMGRLGLMPEDWPEARSILASAPRLRPATVFTHLAGAEDPSLDAYTRGQLALFDELAAEVRELYPGARRHALNTAGMLRFPEWRFELTRLGLGLYGLAPAAKPALPLEEIGSLRSEIVRLQAYPAGARIGYGAAEVLNRPALVATVPAGYADGVPRKLGFGAWRCLVGGKPCPTLGPVCMDLMMLDVTEVENARAGDEVVIFGRQGAAFLSVQEMAEAAGLIPYEVLSGVPARVRRAYSEE